MVWGNSLPSQGCASGNTRRGAVSLRYGTFATGSSAGVRAQVDTAIVRTKIRECLRTNIVFTLLATFLGGCFSGDLVQLNGRVTDQRFCPEAHRQNTSKCEIQKTQTRSQADVVADAPDDDGHDRTPHNSCAEDSCEWAVVL